MYLDTIDGFVALAQKKVALLRRSPVGFLVSSALAGAYVGIGIVLILVLGSAVPAGAQKLVMATTFGIALTLVVIAGAELFTGHNMYMVFGRLRNRVSLSELAATWTACWTGNLGGAVILVVLVTLGGGAGLFDSAAGLLQKIARYKMNGTATELLARAALCNWLVCLAVWMSSRVTSDTAKCIVIWWCLTAFIACGFEHSVANMTLLSLALAGPAADGISLGGMAHNLFWVTLGNIIGGGAFVAGAYWSISRHALASESRTLPSGQASARE